MDSKEDQVLVEMQVGTPSIGRTLVLQSLMYSGMHLDAPPCKINSILMCKFLYVRVLFSYFKAQVTPHISFFDIPRVGPMNSEIKLRKPTVPRKRVRPPTEQSRPEEVKVAYWYILAFSFYNFPHARMLLE